jgi:hypothetical protein
MFLKLVLILLVSISIGLFSKEEPKSLSDKTFTILYLCDINGNFDFTFEGRGGISLLAEIKRQEEEKIYAGKGGVLLLSRGDFFGKKLETHSFRLFHKSKFDSVFIGEKEVSYLEANPNLLKLNLPILASRENLVGIETEKIVEFSGIHFKLSSYLINKLPYIQTKKIHLNLVFPEPGNVQDISDIKQEIPVLFFLPKSMSSAYSFRKNVYTAECPSNSGVVGKIQLTFRGEKLIRQSQEFISLNGSDTNRDWIDPADEVLEELNQKH